MRVLLSGSSGFVAAGLVPALERDGHEIVRLIRGPVGNPARQVRWDPAGGAIDAAGLEGLDAVIHLAGESIASGRWTAAKKARIYDSRVAGTSVLAEALARLERPPQVFVGASAIGYYGDRGDESLDETSAPGDGFLADVCRAWEGAAAPLAARDDVRVAHIRIGVVLDPAGGALQTMLPPFRLGLGGILGSGHQYVSWITRADLVRAIQHVLAHDELEGPVNAVAPRPVTNRELTTALGRAVHRPTVVPMPAVAVRLLLGEMGQELLLASTRVYPRRLLDTGFTFAQPEIGPALEAMLS